MISAKINVEQFGTNFFEVVYSIEKFHTEWKGQAYLKRKDTNEIIRGEGVIRRNKEKEIVDKEIYEAIKNKSSFLSTPPPDWNSNIRKILVHLYKSNEPAISYSVSLNKIIDKDDEKRDNIINDFYAVCKQLVSDTIEQVREIDMLSSQEKLDLLTINEDIFNKPDEDPWTIENESTLRLRAIEYFIRPSKDQIALNKDQYKKYLDYVETLE